MEAKDILWALWPTYSLGSKFIHNSETGSFQEFLQ